MKKVAGAVLTLVMGVGVLSGCGAGGSSITSGNGTNSTSESGSPLKPNFITISVRENTWGARKDNFLEAEIRLNEDLKTENTQVKLDWWPEIGDDQLILQGQAGKVADVFINSSVDMGWEHDAGIIREIDWVKDSAVFKSVPQSYANMMSYDGHYYGAIQDMDASPVFISRKALAGLGWTKEEIDGLRERVDSGDFTFQDLVDLAAQAKQKNVVKTGFAVEDTRFEGWNYAFGSFNYDAGTNKLVLPKQAKDVYAFWADAKERGVISPGIAHVETDQAAPMFVKGEIFAEFARTEFYQMLREASGLKERCHRLQQMVCRQCGLDSDSFRCERR